MGGFLGRLFESGDFPARWQCGRWTAAHGWLHILSDLAIFAAYLAIPTLLLYFIRQRRDMPFPRVFWLFAAFIVTCGVTHLIEAVLFWHPVYRVAGLAKLTTAVASWATLAALVPVLPIALNLRSPAELERLVDARTDALSQANRQLASFGTWVSHDLRAPLRHLDGFVELLRERSADQLDDKTQHYLEQIRGASLEMRQMVDGLLQLSRLGAGELVRTRFELGELVDSVRAELAHASDDRRIEWVIGPLPQAWADPTLLRHVLLNLLDNAIKYTAGTDPSRIEITAVERADEIEISVADDGAGFDPTYSARLFELFQRLHRSEEFPGLGVGLAVAANVVAQHGGQIRGEGQPGAGARFWFTLPKGPA